MANVAVASIATTAYASVSSIVITKPSGLAENDLMIAIIHKEDGAVDTCSLTGWTTIDSMDDSTTGDWAYSLYKVASSADAAAANFTFTLGETKNTGGSILRITDFNIGNPIGQHGYGFDGTNNTAQVFSGGALTPTENGIIIMAICLDQATTQSTYFITNNNPTWTEVADHSGGAAATAIAWGYRPELTNTGNYGSTSAGSARGIGALIQIGNAGVIISETITATDVATNSIGYGVITLETITGTDEITATNNEWNNTDKSSTAWTNQTKS